MIYHSSPVGSRGILPCRGITADIPLLNIWQLVKYSDLKITLNIFLGAYTAMTIDGNIVVDEVLASCYAFSDQNLAHIATIPLRWFPEIMNWIFAVDNESPA